MAQGLDFRQLSLALSRNTKAIDALRDLMLDIERTRRSEQASAKEDLQITVKKAVRMFGTGGSTCSYCDAINCVAGDEINNWVATGCRCCQLSHNLIPKD